MNKIDEPEVTTNLELIINSKGVIEAYATSGGIDGAISWSGILPANFKENFIPLFYALNNNIIIKNPDYIEPTPLKPSNGPTTEQLMINQLGLQVAQLTTKVNELRRDANG